MIVFDQDSKLLAWAANVLKVRYEPKQCAWLSEISNEGEIQAVVVYNRFSPYNCEMSVASNGGKKWFSRRAARAWFGYPFNQMKLRRVTAVAESDNKRSIDMLKVLGFVEEATLKQWFGDKDGIVFRMTRSECKWLT